MPGPVYAADADTPYRLRYNGAAMAHYFAHRARMHWRFVALLLVFIGGVAAQQSLLPVLEGYDETLHFNYVSRLYADNRLPDRGTEASNGPRQESSQPPLGYWTAATFLRLFNVPPDQADPLAELDNVRNRWFTPPDEWSRQDNRNVYYHGPAESIFGHANIVTADHVARLASLFFGLLAIIGAYGAACALFGSGAWALFATAIFAFTPQLLQISAVVSNDASALAFGSLVTWQTVSLMRRGATPARLIGIGLLLGCAGLSKVNALLIGPGVVVALILEWHRGRCSIRRLVVNGLLLGLPALAIFGPWVVWGAVKFGSPLGLEAHNIFTDSRLPAPTLVQVLQALVRIYGSYWGQFAAGSVWMHPVVYALLTVIVGVSLFGGLRLAYSLWRASGAQRRQTWQRVEVQQGAVLVLIAVASFIGLLEWLLRLFAIAPGIQGRLIYPADTAIALLLVGGLYAFVQCIPRRWSRILKLYTVGVPAAAGLLIAPLDIYASFAPPMLLTRAQLPALHGPSIDFNHTIRLLGYWQATPAIYAGQLHTMTFCWEVLAPTTLPAVMAIKILDGSHEIGDRTTVPGLGHFNSSLWQSGDIFCDAVDIVLWETPQPAWTYDVQVNILGWTATAPDGTPIANPLVGQVVSPAGDMSAMGEPWQPTDITFPDLADLAGMSVQGSLQPGQTVRLDLLWKVTRQTPDNWSEFIHLIGPETGVVLGDDVPRDGHYPTSVWSVGDRLVDRWSFQLPPGLSPGRYTIELGFYRHDSGVRLPVQKGNASVADNSVPLLSFDVK